MSFEWKNIVFQRKLCRHSLGEEGPWEVQEVDGRNWKTAVRSREEWRKKCGEARAQIGLYSDDDDDDDDDGLHL
jgi:hypothetical protein